MIHLIELVLEEDILRARERAASMDSAPTSNTLIPNGADTEAGRSTGLLEDDALTEITRTRGENHAGIPDCRVSASEWQKAAPGLLRHQVLLLAMKDGRAPLPVSPALWRCLQRQGFLTDLRDLGSIARRLLFLGDIRMLMSELRTRGSAMSPAKEKTSKETEIAPGNESVLQG